MEFIKKHNRDKVDIVDDEGGLEGSSSGSLRASRPLKGGDKMDQT